MTWFKRSPNPRIIPTVLTDFTRPIWPDGAGNGTTVFATPGVVMPDQTVACRGSAGDDGCPGSPATTGSSRDSRDGQAV